MKITFIDPLDDRGAASHCNISGPAPAGQTARRVYENQQPAAAAFRMSREDYVASFVKLNPSTLS